MKSTLILLVILVICLFLSSCYPEPKGFIGLEDKDNPEVIVTNIQTGDIVSDEFESICIEVEASDEFGIKKVVLSCNEFYDGCYQEPFSFPIYTPTLLDTNYVYAIAYDTSNNTALTDTICFYMISTMIITNPIEDIVLLDIDDQYSIDLNGHFEDSLDPNNILDYYLDTNTNPSIADIVLDDNILSIDPLQYREGSSEINIEITAGDHRKLNYSFIFNVVLSEPFIKVYIPDEQFRNVLFTDYGFTEFTGEDSIVVEEAEALTKLGLTTNSIYSVEGIQAFVNLDSLWISEPISSIDFSSHSLLTILRIEDNNLSELNINPLINLEYLGINMLFLDHNLDLSNNINLEILRINNSDISFLDISNNISLNELSIGVCDLAQIVFPTDTVLDYIRIHGVYSLESLDLVSLDILEYLEIQYTSLSSLDISNNLQLDYIDLRYNEILIETFVWELPLPDYVTLLKDDHNILYVP